MSVPHIISLSWLSVSQNYQIWWRFDEVLIKQVGSFSGPPCRNLCFICECCCLHVLVQLHLSLAWLCKILFSCKCVIYLCLSIEAQLSLGWAEHTTYVWRPSSDFRSRKESDCPVWLQSHTRCGDAAISNATVSARIRQ